jgi:hypothetical protein
MATYLTGPLQLGTGLDNTAAATGYVLQAQTTTVTTVAAGTASSATITLPANSQIVEFYVDTVQDETVGGGTATAINVTVGTAAAGTQYMSSTDMIGGGRAAPTLTTAQLAAMDDIGSNTSVVITADPDGTISTTQAIYRLTVVYAQK